MTDTQLIDDLKNGKHAPVYLLTGEDNYYIDVVSDYIENNIIDPSLRDFDQTVLYGKETDMATVILNAKRYPMMSPVHLVLVKEAQEIELRQWDALAAYLKSPLPQTMLVFCYRHKKLDKRSAAYKAISNTGVVYETKSLYDNQVPSWIRRHVEKHGYTINDNAVMIIAASLGNDLGKIANELSKLFPLIPQGGTITEQIVEEQIGISKDYNVFELQDALVRGDVLKANRITQYFATSKDHPMIKELGILFSFFQNLMLYHYLPDKNERAVASALGISPYFAKDYATAARRCSAMKTLRIIGYFRDTDARMKGINNPSAKDPDLWKELIYKILH